MKKWIGFVTASVCLLTTALSADEALAETPIATQETDDESTSTTPTTDDQAPKHVGQASTDSSNTARASTVAKYALAAGAVAIGITALILVHRHSGHHHH